MRLYTAVRLKTYKNPNFRRLTGSSGMRKSMFWMKLYKYTKLVWGNQVVKCMKDRVYIDKES